MPCSICRLAGHNRSTCPQRPVVAAHMHMPTQPSIVAFAAGFEARRAERWKRDDTRIEARAARIATIIGADTITIDAFVRVDTIASERAAARAQERIRIRDAVSFLLQQQQQQQQHQQLRQQLRRQHQHHPKKIPMPKHISTQIWKQGHPDCMICLSPTTEENFTLSKCGHEYCSTCFSDVRLLKCGACRQDL